MNRKRITIEKKIKKKKNEKNEKKSLRKNY